MASLLAGCGGGVQKSSNPYLAQLATQLDQSCQLQGAQYQKQVQDLNAPETTPQDSLMPLLQAMEDTTLCTLLRDLQYAWEVDFTAPTQQESFEQQKVGDSLIVKVKPSYAGSQSLQSLKIVQEEDQTIRYWSSRLQKDNWLYDLEVELTIHFDEAGLFSTHHIELSHVVPLTSTRVRAMIDGQLIRP